LEAQPAQETISVNRFTVINSSVQMQRLAESFQLPQLIAASVPHRAIRRKIGVGSAPAGELYRHSVLSQRTIGTPFGSTFAVAA
jgi:hypothetical protein